MLIKARSSVSSLAVQTQDIEPLHWEEAHGRISGFIVTLLNAICFESAPSATGLLEAITRLCRTSGVAVSDWGETPKAFVPKRWLHRVFPNDQLDRRTYLVCVADQSHLALKTRNVFVKSSYQHSDPRATTPAAILPVRCTFRIKTGAFCGQEATTPARCVLWSRSDHAR